MKSEDFSTACQEIDRLLGETLAIIQTENAYQGEGAQNDATVIQLLMTAQKKWKEKSLQIAVIALVKSGKSTLLNAWLGNEYLPSSNTPETAHIVRIRHNPTEKNGILKNKNDVNVCGSQQIRHFLEHLNEEARQEQIKCSENELLLEAPLLALADKEFGDQRFELLDTPGTNEAGMEILTTKVERLLDEVDAIIYLLDYTKLKTQEENQFFQKLSSIRPGLLKNYEKRLFFVVNKIDQQNYNSLTWNQTTEYIAEILRTQLGLQVPTSHILPVSAEYALLARLVSSEQATQEAIDSFTKKAMGFLAPPNSTREICLPHIEAMLSTSNIKVVEDAVLNHIFQERGRLLLSTLLSDHLKPALSQFENYLKTALATLQSNQEDLVSKLEELEANRQAVEKQIQAINEKIEKFQQDTKEIICGKFNNFKEQTITKINQAFDKSRTQQRGSFAYLIYSKLQEVIGATFQKEDEIDQKITAINREIMRHFQGEFENFRLDLEREAAIHQQHLFSELREIFEPLARQFETQINRIFNITLEPVPLSFNILSLDQLHKDIEQNKNRLFIEITKETKTKKVGKQMKNKTGGWCSDDEYKTVMIPVEYTVTTHSIKVDEIRESWITRITEMTSISVTISNKMIGEAIKKELGRVQAELLSQHRYYIETIQRERREINQGEPQRQARINDVRTRLDRCQQLRYNTQRCEDFVN